MKVCLIDGPGLACRHHYARLGNPHIDAVGRNLSAVTGCQHAFKQIRNDIQPDLWAMAWEGYGKSHRAELYPKYKANRSTKPSDLVAQFPWVIDMARKVWDLPTVHVKSAEADDVLATLTRIALEAGHEVVIVTSDKDMLQLVGDHVTIRAPWPGGVYHKWDADYVRSNWGVEPENIPDLFALVGDESDGYKGADGVGRVGAVQLLKNHGPTIEHLYATINEPPDISTAIRKKLIASQESVRLSLELATLVKHLPLDITVLGATPREIAEIPV